MYCSVWGEEEELNVLFSVGKRVSVGRRSTKINVCFSTQNQMHEKSVYAKCIYIHRAFTSYMSVKLGMLASRPAAFLDR